MAALQYIYFGFITTYIVIRPHCFVLCIPDVEEQLRAADSRCELLDKQLEYMRRMLNEAEAEKRLAYERSEHMIRLRNANSGQEMRSQMDKIADMEREHHRLQASQAVAQVRRYYDVEFFTAEDACCIGEIIL